MKVLQLIEAIAVNFLLCSHFAHTGKVLVNVVSSLSNQSSQRFDHIIWFLKMFMNIDKCRKLQAEVYNGGDKEVWEREELRSNLQIQGTNSCNR